MKKILLVTIIFITCILNSQSLYARQSHTLYKINQEDANNIVAISSIFYFSMIGYNTGGLPKMAMSLLQDLDTITGFDLFSNRAFLMSHFDEMKVKNPDGYQTYERLQRPENRHVRIITVMSLASE